MYKEVKVEELSADVIIVGGGTSGCYAALTLREQSDLTVIVLEKGNIKRSGCLAAGVNAINAYIVKGRKPEDYVDYAAKDADHIVREDLLLTMSQGLNRVTHKLEEMGLVILKDENGDYVTRGNRNIKINGENMKPILAEGVNQLKDVTVFNHVNVIEYIVNDNQIYGVIGIDIRDEKLYIVRGKKVICTTGGAAGLYRPNNPGFSRHKMWYPPFNTGAGYAMGIRAGAEMTTFEMRFIALRCKDTIAPTGTIAQGVGAKQINSQGEVYETKYGISTSQRVHGTVQENLEGRGPCYLHTKGITPEQEQELMKAYLNMAPGQTLKWMESGKGPSEDNVEIEGTEPYIVGGHTASGYWIDTARRTTIKGLYAAGDVAGGCPQKYVTGALVEGEIAAHTVISDWKEEAITDKGAIIDKESIRNKEAIRNTCTMSKISKDIEAFDKDEIEHAILRAKVAVEAILNHKDHLYTTGEIEEAMQKVMDTYAGGIASNYQYNEKTLNIAEKKIINLQQLSEGLSASDMQEVLLLYELKERLTLCLSVIAHLKARKETRWQSFAQHLDYPKKEDEWLIYVNSKLVEGQLQIILRNLVGREERYEHKH